MGNLFEELMPTCEQCNENESIDGFLCWTCTFVVNEINLTLEWSE